MPLSEIVFTDSGVAERCKDNMAIMLLREYEGLALERDPRGYAVGFSGGKDSLVVRQLCKEAGVKHFCVYNVTGLDPPELVYFKRRQFARYESEGVACRDLYMKKTQADLDGELEKCIDKLCEKFLPKDVRELFEMRKQEQAAKPLRPPRPRPPARQESTGNGGQQE